MNLIVNYFSLQTCHIWGSGGFCLRLETSFIQVNWVLPTWNCRFKYLQIESERQLLHIFVQ